MGFPVNNKFILYAPTWRLNQKTLSEILKLNSFSYSKFNNFENQKTIFF